MIDSLIEITANLFQGFMYIGFLFYFFKNNDRTTKDIVLFVIFSIVMFANITVFSNEIFYRYKAEVFSCVAVMEIYTILICKGNLFIRVIMPVITFVINVVLSYGIAYIISILTGHSYIDLATNSSLYRLFCIVVINLTNMFVYYIIVKIRSKKLALNKWTNVVSFIIIPFISMGIIYSTFQILHMSNYNRELLGYLIVICLAVSVICVISWIMLEQISKSFELKTQLLLSRQHETMYRNNTIQLNDQIDKISKVKHDMKNDLMCIRELLTNEKYSEASRLCNTGIEELASAYVPIHTRNLYLNAIINVELEKAAKNDIDIKIEITDEMTEYSESTDIISIIGNMCDNAIEYLINADIEHKKMELSISRKANYYNIICGNKISGSVLEKNPDMKTTKNHEENHGKGIEIIREKTEKHNGYMDIYEKNGFFIVSAFLSIQSLPEN